MQMSLVVVLALAAGRAQAARPQIVEGADILQRGAAALALEEPKEPDVCYLMKGIKLDGVGHQIFSMITVMGAHGLVGNGLCYVYDARPRDFEIDHMDEETEAKKEAMELLTGFYGDFATKVGPKGCATAELMAKSPPGLKPVNQMPLLLKHVCKEKKFTTWGLDNLWYGSDMDAFAHRQLLSKPDAFMQAVIKNSSSLAVLAAAHLPRADNPPAMAVHMRFGDRANNLLPMAEGQQVLFQSADFQPLVSEFSPVRVFSDTTDKAKTYLTDAITAKVEFCGPNCSTALQAVANMVAADAFVGTFSDLSSTVALMRIGLGKKHTYMPSSWQWAHGFDESELSIYKMADHHQTSCHEHCDEKLRDWCYWCGRHQTDSGLKWMNCCDAGQTYSQDHKCHGAAYATGMKGKRQCVMMVGI